MKRIALNITLSLVALFGAFSCNIKEDMSNCPGSIILDYSAYPDEILAAIAPSEQVDIFVFDPDGICVELYTFTYGELQSAGFEFEVPIQYRNYNAVAWHGLNSETYNSESMKLGVHYDDFYLSLNCDATTQHFHSSLDPLWASSMEPIDYCAAITRHRIYMIRLHTDIELTIYSQSADGELEVLDMDDFLVSIEAENNVYQTDCTLCEEKLYEVEYDNLEELEEGDHHDCACVGTLRLTPDMECVMYVEEQSDSPRTFSFGGASELDLIEYMLACKTDSAQSDQEFLDLNKVWHIELIVEQQTLGSEMGYVVLMLKINGWVVWFSSSELS